MEIARLMFDEKFDALNEPVKAGEHSVNKALVNDSAPLRMAIFGAGGLGRGMMQRVELTPGFKTVAVVDSTAYLYDEEGVSLKDLSSITQLEKAPNAIPTLNGVMDLMRVRGDEIDVVFVALPNIPVEFIPSLAQQIATETPFRGVMVDALKRTKAVEAMLALDETFQNRRILYITGAGATPGFLSTVAAVAAQSFVQIENIDIHFGVGVANWEAYRATIREDFLHLEGFTPEMVAAMTDADIEAELEHRDGLLELVDMEHADDIILERAGICHRDQVTVGGLVDTRNPQKPVQTKVTITGITASGHQGSHVLTLDNATTMVDNVCGPALGFLRQGYELYSRHQLTGVITSADLMPKGHLVPLQRPAYAQSL